MTKPDANERVKQADKGQRKRGRIAEQKHDHQGGDAENRRLDAIALDSIERLDAGDVYRTVRERKISMCGLLPAVVVLDTLQQLGVPRHGQRLGYATSADAGADAGRVVGYAGMLFG